VNLVLTAGSSVSLGGIIPRPRPGGGASSGRGTSRHASVLTNPFAVDALPAWQARAAAARQQDAAPSGVATMAPL